MSNQNNTKSQLQLIPEGTLVWDVVDLKEVLLEHSAESKRYLPMHLFLPIYAYIIDGFHADINGKHSLRNNNPRYSLTEFDYVAGTGKFTKLSYENYLALEKDKESKAKEESFLEVGTEVWDIEHQKWVTVDNVIKSSGISYPIKCCDGKVYTKEGKSTTNSKTYALSLTKYNWITGEGVFTPISAYNELKKLPPDGTRVFHIASQKWFTIDYNSTGINISNTLYPIELIDEDGSHFDSCTLDGYLDSTDEQPHLSLTEFNYLKGTGKFTPITEWRTINS
jgi:hypothetical protein